MILLTLVDQEGRATPVTTWGYFRITGGVVWTRPGDEPLVRYFQASWRYAGSQWPGMRFEGRCRIVFGLISDPAGVSDLLEEVSIFDCTLSANGVPLALLEPARDMWRGAGKDAWWHSFRVESAGLRPTAQRLVRSDGPIPPPGPPPDRGNKRKSSNLAICIGRLKRLQDALTPGARSDESHSPIRDSKCTGSTGLVR